jgi:hypothetical protein
MISLQRLRYKIFTSFAIAALGAVALVRIAVSVPVSPAMVTALLIAGILVLAGLWRGMIYLRGARVPARPSR